MVELFTDGSCDVRTGLGGIAGILRCNGKEAEYSEAYCQTTIDRMEIMAVLVGLYRLKMRTRVVVTLDRQNVVNGINSWMYGWARKNWKRKPANEDLWREMHRLCTQVHQVEALWTKGHKDHPENIRCDKLCGEARINGPHLLDFR